jgi:PAS domain S-box-containing protein
MMIEGLMQVFSSGSFIPHGHCYLWQPGLVWLHILSDSLIAIAYYSIPLTLFYFVQKRQDLPFDWIFLLFGAFIVSCGTTHLMEIWTLWHPVYWLSGLLKASTAAISVYTAVMLVRLMPKALALPSPMQLKSINQSLEQQMRDRQQAEAQVRQLNQELEAKVAARTLELENSMAQVSDYVERVTLAMDAARLGSWDWNLETNVVLWNAYHEILWGYPPGTPERTYEDWRRRVHPDDLPQIEATVQAAMAAQTDLRVEYRILWEDGSQHWIAAFGRFYYDAQQQPQRMVGMVQDITERKQTEASLHLSEERLRLATEAADIGMWFWDLAMDDLVWTTRCKTLFGLAPNAPMSYPRFLEILHPDDRDRTHQAVQTAIQQQQDYYIEYRCIWPDQSVHWIVARGRALYDDQGKPMRMMGMTQDITDRKQAEVELKERTYELSQLNMLLVQANALINQRNQELDQFAHIVSHDLKAPLRAIANLSEWIEEDLADQVPPETKQSLDLLRSRVHRMEALINGLLAYAKINHQNTPSETFAVGDLLHEIIDSLDIPPEFTVQIPADLPTLNTSRLLLNQVLTNLISNAIKHHDRPDGRVEITVQPQSHGYEFIIADDGPGIAPKHHERVFGIFQTLASRDQKESTGVGLAIVKKIVQRIGGHIQLESQPNQGATFRFTWLPS